MKLTDDLIPLKRPHFQLRDKQLFFLISSRPFAELDSEGAALWNSMDGSASVGQLRHNHPNALMQLQRFYELGACELAPERFPQDRRRILVIEPHMDDAALSVGGLMWSQRQECEFTVLSIVGISNFTSYYYSTGRGYFDVDIVTRLRKAESELVMRLLGGKHLSLDKHDAPLRYQPGNWTRDWYHRNSRSISAYINHSATDAELESWTSQIVDVLVSTDAKEIWFPCGIGSSADHELTRNACLQALNRIPRIIEQTPIYFYQDVPYASRYPRHTSQIMNAISASGGIVERIYDEIGEVMADKLRLISIFGSQFKMKYMEPGVRESARLAAQPGNGLGEVRFRLRRLPGPMVPLAMYSGRASVEKSASRLTKWYPRHRSAQRIRMLCPAGIGAWADDLSQLLKAFPQATLEVHVTGDSVDETNQLKSPRIEVLPVQGLGRGWIKRIIQVILSKPSPLIVVTSTRLQHLELFVRAAFMLADPLPVSTVDHLVQALQTVQRTDN